MSQHRCIIKVCIALLIHLWLVLYTTWIIPKFCWLAYESFDSYQICFAKVQLELKVLREHSPDTVLHKCCHCTYCCQQDKERRSSHHGEALPWHVGPPCLLWVPHLGLQRTHMWPIHIDALEALTITMTTSESIAALIHKRLQLWLQAGIPCQPQTARSWR